MSELVHVKPSPVATQSMPMRFAARCSPNCALPIVMNWTTATRMLRPDARVMTRQAALDLPLPWRVLTMTRPLVFRALRMPVSMDVRSVGGATVLLAIGLEYDFQADARVPGRAGAT